MLWSNQPKKLTLSLNQLPFNLETRKGYIFFGRIRKFQKHGIIFGIQIG